MFFFGDKPQDLIAASVVSLTSTVSFYGSRVITAKESSMPGNISKADKQKQLLPNDMLINGASQAKPHSVSMPVP